MLTWLNFFEWVGCVLGVAGAILVAVKSQHARWAWVMWLVSNLCWTAYGIGTNNLAITLQQGAFSVTSMIGLWHWVLRPAMLQNQAATASAAAT